jgi:hypothetical protein
MSMVENGKNPQVNKSIHGLDQPAASLQNNFIE